MEITDFQRTQRVLASVQYLTRANKFLNAVQLKNLKGTRFKDQCEGHFKQLQEYLEGNYK